MTGADKEELVELAAAAMYGSGWNGPLEKQPGPRMKEVWREHARKALSVAWHRIEGLEADIHRLDKHIDELRE